MLPQTFDGNILKMKAVSYLDNKEQETVFLLVYRTWTLVLSALFLHARLGAQVNLYAQKFRCLERNLSTPEKDYQTVKVDQHSL